MSLTSRPSETEILVACEERLRNALPPGWRLNGREVRTDNRVARSFFEVESPSTESVTLTVLVLRSIQPKALIDIIDQLHDKIEPLRASDHLLLIASDYLSATTQQVLFDRRVSWIDSTGNMRLVTSRPGLFIERKGAQKDPWRRDDPLQTLRGSGAGRAVRALIDSRPPYGVRELALKSGASAATLSRVIDLLEREAILERDSRGGVAGFDWPAALRRWAQDYPGLRSRKTLMCLEPRGFNQLSRKLASTTTPYALTESLAARSFAAVAPTLVAVVYVNDPLQFQKELDLRTVDVGANVMLVEAIDSVAFDRTLRRDGVTIAAPSQIAVDLLTGPGREPAEGEALIEWMQRNEDVWRR